MTDSTSVLREWLRRNITGSTRRRLNAARTAVGLGPPYLRLRKRGFEMLSGSGLEIGAFEHPADVPRHCRVEYVDVISPEEAARLFPELDASSLVKPTYLCDVDSEGLAKIASGSRDFVIACHVIEHVANPGRFVAELVRVLRPGGLLAIAAPDKRFCSDRDRPLTPIAQLEKFFVHGRPTPGPEDYRELLEFVHPDLARGSPEQVQRLLEELARRREHLSVWTSDTFREFLVAAFGWSGNALQCLYEAGADQSRYEYFGVWKKP